MRNYLLAGTSALALTLSAGAALADTAPGKFDIKISGDAFFEGGYVDQRQDKNALNGTSGATASVSGVDFQNRFRLNINPVATADNGLTYGAYARIRANGAAGTIDGDKAYVYVSGNFGEFRGGVTYGPSDVTYVSHPQDWQMLGIYDQWRSYVNGGGASTAAGNAPLGYNGSGTNYNTAGRGTGFAWGQFNGGGVASEGVQLLNSHSIDTKLVYYSPRFFGQTPTTGLQGAVSYAPRSGDGTAGLLSVNTDVNRSRFDAGNTTTTQSVVGTTIVNTVTAQQLQRLAFDDEFELTANYVEKWGPWMLKVSGGYAGGSSHNDGPGSGAAAYNDLESFQFGAQVGYENFILGGGYVYGGKSGYTKARFVSADGKLKSDTTGVTTKLKDQTAWNVGGQYTFGPLVVGVKFMEETDAGNLAYTGDRTLDAVTFGGMYTVAPGLRLGLEYTYYDATSNVPVGVNTGLKSDDNGSVILARTVVTF